LIERALQFAVLAHAGQRDDYGLPVILHPVAVASRVSRRSPLAGPEMVAAAFLHDTVEDTFVGLATIKTLFGERVAVLVDAMTRREGEDYKDYLKRLVAVQGACVLKTADLQDNAERPCHFPPGKPSKRDKAKEKLAMLKRLAYTAETL